MILVLTQWVAVDSQGRYLDALGNPCPLRLIVQEALWSSRKDAQSVVDKVPGGEVLAVRVELYAIQKGPLR